MKSKKNTLENLTLLEYEEIIKSIKRYSLNGKRIIILILSICYMITAIGNSNFNAFIIGIIWFLTLNYILGRYNNKYVDYGVIIIFTLLQIYSMSPLIKFNLFEIIVIIIVVLWLYIRSKIYHLNYHKTGFREKRGTRQISLIPVTLISIKIYNSINNEELMLWTINIAFLLLLILLGTNIFNYHFETELEEYKRILEKK